MRLIFKLFFWFLVLTCLGLALAVWFSLSSQPLVVNNVRLSHEDIARAQVILRENDPRQLASGEQSTIIISESDLNLAANYLLQKKLRGGARVSLTPGNLDALGTVQLPIQPLQRYFDRSYVNIHLHLTSGRKRFTITRLQIGQLRVPDFVAKKILKYGLPLFYQRPEYQLANRVIRHIDPQEEELHITFQWDPTLIDSVQSTFLNDVDKAALQVYYDYLLVLQKSGLSRNGSLTHLLQPMFALAQQRSLEQDPVAENIALLTLLGVWATNKDLAQLIPDLRTRPHRFLLKLERRTDFARHFLGSAALTARGDSALADAIGIYKEVADSNHGSGFSFTDIAADRAGVRFGELATRSAASARKVQAFMAARFEETDIMPKARDLPEFLNSSELKRRYGSVGSDAYNDVMAEIERRINACRIHREIL